MRGPDPHFPVAHVRPRLGWVNDPNGPIWLQGRCHLFFQYAPTACPEAGDVVWGHSSSTDLVTWDIHGTALQPSAEHPCAQGFWSGTTVVDDGRLVAFYSAYRDGDPYQPPRLTISKDAGQSFRADRFVVGPPAEGGLIFRDPFVWRQHGRWRLLMGSGRADWTEAQVRLYESEDLLNWAERGVFAALSGQAADPLDPGSAWECPQYAPELGVLFVGAWRPKDAPMAVLAITGREHESRFDIAQVERADHGPEFYAPSLMRSPDGRYLLWGVVREARDLDWQRGAGWAGLLSLPREVSMDGGRLVTLPARELEGLRLDALHEYEGGLSEVVLAQVPRAFELHLRCLQPARALALTLDLGGDQQLVVHVDGETGLVVVDRDASSSDSRACGGRTIVGPLENLSSQGTLELRWLVDHSVSELFVAGSAVTHRFFPVPAGPWRLRVAAPGARQMALRLWPLRACVRAQPV